MFIDRNVIDIMFVLDDEAEADHKLGACLTKHGYSIKYEARPLLGDSKRTIPGYDRQQWSTFYMDKHSKSDYIGVIDADGMIFSFLHPLYSIFHSDTDRRIMLKPLEGDHYKEDKVNPIKEESINFDLFSDRFTIRFNIGFYVDKSYADVVSI